MSTALTLAKDTQAIGYADALRPRNLPEAMQLADMLAKSDLVPKDYRGKPGNVVAAVQMGAELGLAPMQALQNIAVINGRPSVWGDAMLALCQAHPDFEDIAETDDGAIATCVIKRRGRTPVSRTFSMEDAKRAGLLGKQGPWSQYPARMRQMRARGFALRDSFADALKGLSSAEEVSDYAPVRAEQIEQPAAPRQSVTAAAREKLRAKAPTPNGVILEISGAADEAALKAAAEKAKSLPAEEQEAARLAYKARAKELREEEWRRKQAPPHDAETGEVVDHDYGPPPMSEEEAATDE